MWDSYTLWNSIWYMQLIGLRIMALLYFYSKFKLESPITNMMILCYAWGFSYLIDNKYQCQFYMYMYI